MNVALSTVSDVVASPERVFSTARSLRGDIEACLSNSGSEQGVITAKIREDLFHQLLVGEKILKNVQVVLPLDSCRSPESSCCHCLCCRRGGQLNPTPWKHHVGQLSGEFAGAGPFGFRHGEHVVRLQIGDGGASPGQGFRRRSARPAPDTVAAHDHHRESRRALTLVPRARVSASSTETGRRDR